MHVPMGNLDLDILASEIRAELARDRAGRTVIDSLAELVKANREVERFPAYKRSLIGLSMQQASSLLITNESLSRGGDAVSGLKVLMFLFDNVINLRYMEEDGPDIGRAMSVIKMRSSDHASTLNRVAIGETGIEVGTTIVGASGASAGAYLRSESLRATALKSASP